MDSVHLHRPDIDFGKRSLKYKAAKFYNNLTEEIRFVLVTLGDTINQFWETTHLILNIDNN